MGKIVLQLGQSYNFRVIDLEENYSNFTGQTGIKYCHRFILGIDEEEVDCQICTDHPTQNFCGKGDYIEATLKKYNKGQYTISNILQKGGSPGIPSIPKQNTPVPGEPPARTKNVLLGGSAASLALSAAITFETQKSKMPGEDTPAPADVLTTADQFYDWLIKKNQI